MKIAKKIVYFSLSLLCAASCANVSKTDEVVVACNLPMTGDISMYGQYIKDGITMAMDDLSDSLSYYDIKINYKYEDNKSSAKDAVTAFTRHKTSPFDIYVSSATAQSLAIDKMVKQTGKPHFIWSFYPLSLSSDDDFYRVWIDMEYESQCFINYIKKAKPKTVAFLYQDLSSTQEQFAKNIAPYMAELGVKIVYNEPYAIDKVDFKDVVSKIKASNPDITIVYGFQNHVSEIIKGLNINKYKKDGNILCSFDFLDVQNILEPELLDGIITNVPQFIIDEDPYILDWKLKFENKFGRKSLFTDAYAYDFGTIMYEACKIRIKTPELSLIDAIMKIDLKGITGPLKFDATGQINNNIETCIYKDGKFVKL